MDLPQLPSEINSVGLIPLAVGAKKYGEWVIDLPSLDYSAMSAIVTCPRWGVGRYVHHRVVKSNGRATALEAGAAAHDFFAAVRMCQHLFDKEIQYYKDIPKYWHDTGDQLFGSARWDLIVENMENAAEPYTTDSWKLFCISAFETSGYEDYEYDKRRTVYNIETALLHYYDRWSWVYNRLWCEDGVLGIELEVNMVLVVNDEPFIRFVGKIDGVHQSGDRVWIGENKTTGRISQPWINAFNTSHQVTGYIIALSTLLQRRDICDVTIFALQIPLPRDMYTGYQEIPQVRELDAGAGHEWFNWLLDAYEQVYKYHADPMAAPMYTHSCNRFFSTCPYMSICAEFDLEERRVAFEEYTEVDRWSPLDDPDNAGEMN